MKRIGSFVLFVLLLISLCTPALAQPVGTDISPTLASCGVCEGAESESWARSAPGKIVRGLTNAGLGWTNLFAQPVHLANSGESVLTGVGKGFGYLFIRTIQGVVEIGIFWLPPTHDEPLKNCALGDLGITGR